MNLFYNLRNGMMINNHPLRDTALFVASLFVFTFSLITFASNPYLWGWVIVMGFALWALSASLELFCGVLMVSNIKRSRAIRDELYPA